MTNIEIHRYGFAEDSTLGKLYVDEEFECFTLEDERRTVKVKGETCIPPGTYELKLRTAGGLHEKYKARFPEVHVGMLWLQDVPNFQWVYLHIGNDDDDTEGCPLTGDVPTVMPDGEFKVARSTDAYLRLYKRVAPLLEAGERVVVHVSEDVREAAA